MSRSRLFLMLISCICLVFSQGGTNAATPAPVQDKSHQAIFDDAVNAFDKGDYETAFALFQSINTDKDPAVLRNLGHMARKGLGTEQDLNAAFHYYLRAAEIGLPTAQLNVANAYEHGEGIGVNLTEARHWRGLAARADHPLGHLAYGKMLSAGQGGQIKRDEALVHLTRAFEQGVTSARPEIAQLMHDIFIAPADSAQDDQKNKNVRNQPAARR